MHPLIFVRWHRRLSKPLWRLQTRGCVAVVLWRLEISFPRWRRPA